MKAKVVFTLRKIDDLSLFHTLSLRTRAVGRVKNRRDLLNGKVGHKRNAENVIYVRPSGKKVLTSDRLPAALLLPINYPDSAVTGGQHWSGCKVRSRACARELLRITPIRSIYELCAASIISPTTIIGWKIPRTIILR